MNSKFLALIVLLAIVSPAIAAIDAYPFPNEQMRERYHRLIDELRCPQCLNTNLAGSDSMIARDLRREVHGQLLAGKSDEEILEFMHERYGDFILYKPRLKAGTVVLWFTPAFLILVAALVLVRIMMRSQPEDDPALDEAERQRLNRLLSDK